MASNVLIFTNLALFSSSEDKSWDIQWATWKLKQANPTDLSPYSAQQLTFFSPFFPSQFHDILPNHTNLPNLQPFNSFTENFCIQHLLEWRREAFEAVACWIKVP